LIAEEPNFTIHVLIGVKAGRTVSILSSGFERILMCPKELATKLELCYQNQITRSELAKEIKVAHYELLDFERLVRDGVIEKIERHFERKEADYEARTDRKAD